MRASTVKAKLLPWEADAMERLGLRNVKLLREVIRAVATALLRPLPSRGAAVLVNSFSGLLRLPITRIPEPSRTQSPRVSLRGLFGEINELLSPELGEKGPGLIGRVVAETWARSLQPQELSRLRESTPEELRDLWASAVEKPDGPPGVPRSRPRRRFRDREAGGGRAEAAGQRHFPLRGTKYVHPQP